MKNSESHVGLLTEGQRRSFKSRVSRWQKHMRCWREANPHSRRQPKKPLSIAMAEKALLLDDFSRGFTRKDILRQGKLFRRELKVLLLCRKTYYIGNNRSIRYSTEELFRRFTQVIAYKSGAPLSMELPL